MFKAILLMTTLVGLQASAASTPHVLIYSFSTNGVPHDSSYTAVLDDGTIMSWNGDSDTPTDSAKLLGHLSFDVVAKIKARVESIPQNLPLLDSNPHQAYCNNTHVQAFVARKANGHKVNLSRTAGCHTSASSDSYDAEFLSHFIDGMDSLQNLTRE